MRFKYFLQEHIKESDISELKNIISGISEKNASENEKVENGILFQINDLGAWGRFKSKLVETLLDDSWKDLSENALLVHLKNRKYHMWIKYENSTANFFITDKDLKEPEWKEEKTEEE